MKIVLGGDMPGGEHWETGFWMAQTGVDNEATANAQAEIIGGTLNSSDPSGAMRELAADVWSSQVRWVWVKCYLYTGGTTAAAIGMWTLPTARAGSGNPLQPNQCAIVLTLRTGGAGRRRRGRMYLPCQTPGPLTTGGELQPSTVNNLTASWAAAFTDINASDAGKIIVLSQVAGSFNQVSSVSMDSRQDIQRRRAKSQIIEHVATGVVAL